MVEISAVEQNKETRMKINKDRLRYLWNNIKHTNTHITGALDVEESEKGPEKILKDITAESFSNKKRNSHPSPGSANNAINPRRNIETHTLTKLTIIKDKEKTLKATR